MILTPLSVRPYDYLPGRVHIPASAILGPARGGVPKLEIICFHPVSPNTMDLLEHTVRFHEEFMLEAVPKRFLLRSYSRISWGKRINVEQYPLGMTMTIGSSLMRLHTRIGSPFRYGLRRAPRHSWNGVAVRAREGFPIRTYTKGDFSIADTLLAYEENEIPPGEEFNRGCAYSLWAGLFVDLYFALGDWEFRQGFRRLYVAIRDGHYSAECDGPRSGICYVGAAFVKYAPPEPPRLPDPSSMAGTTARDRALIGTQV